MSESNGIAADTEALLDATTLFQKVFDEGPLGMAVVDLGFRIIQANDCFCEMLGYSRQELTRLHIPDITHPDDIEIDLHQTKQLVVGVQSYGTIHKRYVAKDGTTVWARVTRTLVKDDVGLPSHFLTMVEDISQFHQIEDELQESESKFRSVIESTQEAIILTDSDANIISWNRGAERIFQYYAAEVMGQPLNCIIPPRFRGAHHRGVARLRQGGAPRLIGKMIEVVGMRQDGSEFPIELSLSSWKQRGQTFYGGVIRDISQRKQAEIAQSQLAAIVNSSNGAIVGKSLDGIVVIWNTGAKRLYGYDSHEIIGHNADILVPEDRRAEEEQFLKSVEQGLAIEHLETIRLTKTGARINVAVTVSPILDSEGKLIGVSTIAQDITERKIAEAFIKQQAELLEMAHDAIVVRDMKGKITFWNKGAEKMYGWSREEALGHTTQDLLKTRFSISDEEIKVLVLRSGEWKGEFRQTRRDGAEVIVASRWAVQWDGNNEPVAILEINNDITERKRVEEESLRAHRAAEKASAAKSEFLSRMSHELRTPMNAILGFAQLLEMDELDKEQAESVEQILRGGEHLLGLINEVLDITRIETGNLTFSLEPVLVSDLLDEALAMMRPLARKAQISLSSELEDIEGAFVTADQQRLKQVLLNLISNAIKYNRNNGAVRIVGSNPSEEWLRIEVIDTGLGILPHQIDRLFEPFERLQAAQTDVQGTGLGLALSKHLVEAMGGIIGIHSEPDRGSTFWVELPTAIGIPVPSSDAIEAPLPFVSNAQNPVHTVLYIEDNLANLRLVQRLMERRPQVELLVTPNGSEGISLAQQRHPDLLLLDMHLPDLWGDEVLRRLKANEKTQDIPVVILSADVAPGRVERLMEAGAQDYLVKPLDVKRFFGILDGILSKPADSVKVGAA